MQPTIFLINSTTTNRRIQGQLNYVYEEERKKKLNMNKILVPQKIELITIKP